MTQKEQRLSQPSCTLRLGRVRSLAASKTGAARSSVWAKMSETKVWTSDVGPWASDLGPWTSDVGFCFSESSLPKDGWYSLFRPPLSQAPGKRVSGMKHESEVRGPT